MTTRPTDDPLAGHCLTCGRPLVDHTVTELRAHCDVRLPYEDIPGGPFEMANPLGDGSPASCQLSCSAAVFKGDLPAAGPIALPVIIFRFEALAGSPPIPPVSLILEDTGMRDLHRLVGDAAEAAVRAARKAR